MEMSLDSPPLPPPPSISLLVPPPAPTMLLPAFEHVPVNSTTGTPNVSSALPPPLSKSSPASGPSAGPSKFFSRSRANSLHTSSASPSTSAIVPPLPCSPTLDTPAIKSCSVPYHTKLAGRTTGTGWVFAVRVVPDTSSENDLDFMARRALSRKISLGKMRMDEGVARDPYTIFRSWSEFVDLSNRLQSILPAQSPSSTTSHSSPLPGRNFPSPFAKSPPRLTRKLTLFVTRATLVQRQVELDFFVRRLFEMDTVVTGSPLVSSFFKPREGDSLKQGKEDEENVDAIGVVSPNATVRAPSTSSSAGRRPRLMVKHSVPNLRSGYEADLFDSPDSPASPYSTTFAGASGRSFGRGTIRPGMTARSQTALEVGTADADYPGSEVSSICSGTTITPQSAPSFSRAPTLVTIGASPQMEDIERFERFEEEKEAVVEVEVKPPKKRLPLLRHFRSLQDLRHPSSSSSTSSVPPVPSPTSATMARAKTLPPASPVSASAPRAAPRARASSKSSTGSFEACGDSLAASLNSMATTGASLLQQSTCSTTTSGAPSTCSSESVSRQRPPMIPRTSSMANSCGHSPSPSASRDSMDSLRSSLYGGHGSFEMSRSGAGSGSGSGSVMGTGQYSRRSSTDFSEGFGAPNTPPTPYLESREDATSLIGGSGGGKYFLNDFGALASNNCVPLPPFFPVPPSMSYLGSGSIGSAGGAPMAAAWSYEGMSYSPRLPPTPTTAPPSYSHQHRRNNSDSYSSRSRAGSSASVRPGLDTIVGSPQLGSSARRTSQREERERERRAGSISKLDFLGPLTPAVPVAPAAAPMLTIKILHLESIIVRVRHSITLPSLRTQVGTKFAEGGIVLEEGWTLAVGKGDSLEAVASAEHFRTLVQEAGEKLALRIVVA